MGTFLGIAIACLGRRGERSGATRKDKKMAMMSEKNRIR